MLKRPENSSRILIPLPSIARRDGPSIVPVGFWYKDKEIDYDTPTDIGGGRKAFADSKDSAGDEVRGGGMIHSVGIELRGRRQGKRGRVPTGYPDLYWKDTMP